LHGDFLPTASWERLKLRATLLRRLRQFFEHRNFLEVETPLLSAEVIGEEHIEPIAVESPDRNLRYLQASPEAHMKRLMAAGGEAIYQVTRSFRRGERGKLHNPEFTIVEWYRRGDSMEQGIALLGDLCSTLLETEEPEVITYGEAFERCAGVDPHTTSVDALVEVAMERGVAVPEGMQEIDDLLNLLLAKLVEAQLGHGKPTVMWGYPASQASLAKLRGHQPPVAERFELYVRGVEVANGFCELTDADELRKRLVTWNDARIREGKQPLRQPQHLLAAMDHGLPASAGCALGFDRLVALAAHAQAIHDVIAFPADRA